MRGFDNLYIIIEESIKLDVYFSPYFTGLQRDGGLTINVYVNVYGKVINISDLY